MTSVRSAPRLSRAIAAFGAVLATASCASAPESGRARPVAFDGDAAQVLRYCEKLQEAGDLRVAASVCQRAHALEPQNPEPLLRLAEILQQLGEPRLAADAYRAILAFDPSNVDALYGLGNAYVIQKHYKLAVDQFEAGAKHKPDDVRFYNALGVTRDQMGAHKDAQAYYRKGLQVDPENRTLLNNLGLSLTLSGQHAEGTAILRDLANSPGSGPTSRQNLALAYGVAGNTDAAARIAQIDLPPQIVQRNLEYYATLRAAEEKSEAKPAAEAPEEKSRAKPAAEAKRQAPSIASAAKQDREDGTPRTLGKPTPLLQEKPLQKPVRQSHVQQKPARPEPEQREPAADVGSNRRSEPATTPHATVARAEAPNAPKSAAKSSTQTAARTDPVQAASRVASSKESAGEAKTASANKPSRTDNEALDEIRGKGLPPKEAAADASEEKTPRTPSTTSPASTGKPKSSKGDAAASAGEKPTSASGRSIADGYAVQLGSYYSEQRAQRGWRELQGAANDLLGRLKPEVRRAEVGTENNVYYRLHTAPTESKSEADALCVALKKRSIDCLVVKAEPPAPPAAKPAPARADEPQPQPRQQTHLPATPASEL